MVAWQRIPSVEDAIDAPASAAIESKPSALPIAGALRAMGAAIMWSTSGILIDRLDGQYHLSALEISTWRVLLVLPILGIWVARQRPDLSEIGWSDLPFLAIIGIFGVTLSNVTWAASVHLNHPAAAAALAFSAPAIIALGDRFLFGSKLNVLQWTAVAVNLVGCGLASGLHGLGDLIHTPTGLLVGLANGSAFAVYTLTNRGIAHSRAYSASTLLLLMFSFGEIGLLAWGLPVEGSKLFLLHLDLRGWMLLVAVAIGPTLLAYALFNSSLKVLPATVASLVTTLEPPIVAVASLVLLGRQVSVAQWTGIGAIVAAVLTMQLTVASRRGRRVDT